MAKKKKFNVAVLGATGAVGQEMLSILGQRNFPVDAVVPLASEKSLGKTVEFRGGDIAVSVARPEAFKGIDIVLSSAGASVSKEMHPHVRAAGAVMIDNTSAFRMEPDVPLVVPEVNPHAIAQYRNQNLIANPNCSTIQMVVALKPLHDAAKIKRIVVSTYQSVSGAGHAAVEELWGGTQAVYNQDEFEYKKFAHPIAFNLIPQIDVFMDDGYTKEEWKMSVETTKIMGVDIPLTATCVRVPVFYTHSEAVWIETERPLSPEQARTLLSTAPGVRVMDDPAKKLYPMPRDLQGQDAVGVGRIRRDPTVPHGLSLWVVGDNVRKGAALNAVQIAEKLVEYL